MTHVAKERAYEVGELPHVRRWLKRFLKLAADMPPEVWVYVASGTAHVMANGEDGRPIENDHGRGDGMDKDASIDYTRDGSWDGGDW